MGKSRRNRNRDQQRSGPVAKPVKPLTDPELVSLRESRILPIVQNLTIPEPTARTAAAAAVAGIAWDSRCRKLLLREQVVHIVLTETLTDASPESRAAGWEILKILAREEESDFCVHLYRLDILAAIENAGKAVADTLLASEPPVRTLPEAQQRVLWEMAAALVLLLGSLALSRDEVLESIVGNGQILRFLFVLATNEATSRDLVSEVLSCLMTLSEESAEFGQAAVDDQSVRFYRQLLGLKEGTGLRAVYACGILHNIFYSLQWQDHSPGKDGASDAVLIPALTRNLNPAQLPTMGEDPDDPNPPETVEAVRMALEIVASIGTDLQSTLEKASRSEVHGQRPEAEWNGFDDEGGGAEAMDEDGSIGDADGADHEGGDEEMGQDEIEADMEMVTGADHEGTGASEIDDLPTLRGLIDQALPLVIRCSQTPLINHEATALQSLALSALNNIAWTMSCFDFTGGENESVYRAWAPAARSIWSCTVGPILASDTSDVGLATQITGLAWATARSLGGDTPLSGYEHHKFMTLYRASSALERSGEPASSGEVEKTGGGDRDRREGQGRDPLQGLGVKCVGVLGHLGRSPASAELNHEIGVFLLDVVLGGLPETPAADAVEALNQLFDMYKDESPEYDGVFWRNKFLARLEEVTPKVKAAAKAVDKRRFAELRAKADEAVVNLARFIKYKRKHAP